MDMYIIYIDQRHTAILPAQSGKSLFVGISQSLFTCRPERKGQKFSTCKKNMQINNRLVHRCRNTPLITATTIAVASQFQAKCILQVFTFNC